MAWLVGDSFSDEFMGGDYDAIDSENCYSAYSMSGARELIEGLDLFHCSHLVIMTGSDSMHSEDDYHFRGIGTRSLYQLNCMDLSSYYDDSVEIYKYIKNNYSATRVSFVEPMYISYVQAFKYYTMDGYNARQRRMAREDLDDSHVDLGDQDFQMVDYIFNSFEGGDRSYELPNQITSNYDSNLWSDYCMYGRFPTHILESDGWLPSNFVYRRIAKKIDKRTPDADEWEGNDGDENGDDDGDNDDDDDDDDDDPQNFNYNYGENNDDYDGDNGNEQEENDDGNDADDEDEYGNMNDFDADPENVYSDDEEETEESDESGVDDPEGGESEGYDNESEGGDEDYSFDKSTSTDLQDDDWRKSKKPGAVANVDKYETCPGPSGLKLKSLPAISGDKYYKYPKGAHAYKPENVTVGISDDENYLSDVRDDNRWKAHYVPYYSPAKDNADKDDSDKKGKGGPFKGQKKKN